MVSYYAFPGLKLSALTGKQRECLHLTRRKCSGKAVLNAICKYYNVEEEDVKRKGRKRPYVWCRQVYYYICSYMTRLSLKQMGQMFDQDHTTVVHSKKLVKDILDTEPERKVEIREIEELIEFIPT